MSWARSDIAEGLSRANNHADEVRTKSICHVLLGETNSLRILRIGNRFGNRYCRCTVSRLYLQAIYVLLEIRAVQVRLSHLSSKGDLSSVCSYAEKLFRHLGGLTLVSSRRSRSSADCTFRGRFPRIPYRLDHIRAAAR